MITETEQQNILETVRSMSEGVRSREEREMRRHLLMVGVTIALKPENIPPFWYINISCGRTDRLFAK